MHIKVLIKTMTNRWRISKLLKNDNLIWMMDHHYFVSFGNQWRLVKVLKTGWTIIEYYCKVIILSVEFILMKSGLHFLNQIRAYQKQAIAFQFTKYFVYLMVFDSLYWPMINHFLLYTINALNSKEP